MNRPATAETAAPLAVGSALAAGVILGFNPVATKMLYHLGMSPAEFLVARPLWTLGLFAVVAIALRPRAFARSDGWKFLVLGLCYGPGIAGLLPLGLSKTSATHAVLLYSLGPPLTAALGALLLREPLSRLKTSGMLAGVAGAAIVAFGGAHAHKDSLIGDALVMGMVLATAIQALVLRRIDGTYKPLFMAAFYGAIGSVMLLGLTLPLAGARSVAAPLHLGTSGALLFFGEIVVGVSLLAQAFQTLALRSLTAGLVSALLRYGSLLVGVVLAIVALRERVMWNELAGGVLLAISVALTLLPEHRKSAKPTLPHAHPDFHPMHH